MNLALKSHERKKEKVVSVLLESVCSIQNVNYGHIGQNHISY